jgi:gluconokinase
MILMPQEALFSPLPTALIVMGVSGCGKSTVGEVLAHRLAWPFRDGDDFHPAANVEKMRAGIALTDQDRWPWLAAIAAWIGELRLSGRHGIVACSALKRAYRDALRDGHADVRFVHLTGGRALIASRLAARTGHYMPPSLLDSQLATLEAPAADENAVTVSIAPPPDGIAAAVLERLGLDAARARPA